MQQPGTYCRLYYCNGNCKDLSKLAEYGVISGCVRLLRPAVVALIASAGISILITAFWGNDMITFAGTNPGLVTIFIICIFLIQKVKMNPVWVMLLAGVMKVGVSCAQRL